MKLFSNKVSVLALNLVFSYACEKKMAKLEFVRVINAAEAKRRRLFLTNRKIFRKHGCHLIIFFLPKSNKEEVMRHIVVLLRLYSKRFDSLFLTTKQHFSNTLFSYLFSQSHRSNA